MRIYTNDLHDIDLVSAAVSTGVQLYRHNENTSRKRARMFDVILSGSSKRAPQFSSGPSRYRPATWDEWGIFLAHLFAADESVTIPGIYDDAEAFHWLTGERFRTLVPADQHGHVWDNVGRCITGAYYIDECSDVSCNARKRRLAPGYTMAALSM